MTDQFETVKFTQLPVPSLLKIGFVSNVFFWISLILLAWGMTFISLFELNDIPYASRISTMNTNLLLNIIIVLFFSLFGAIAFTIGVLIAGWALKNSHMTVMTYKLTDRQMRNKAYMKRVMEAQQKIRMEERQKQ